eukprot:scaffold2799_cov408-Prasinococcus_capsulatus_cf.AAC.28
MKYVEGACMHMYRRTTSNTQLSVVRSYAGGRSAVATRAASALRGSRPYGEGRGGTGCPLDLAGRLRGSQLFQLPSLRARRWVPRERPPGHKGRRYRHSAPGCADAAARQAGGGRLCKAGPARAPERRRAAGGRGCLSGAAGGVISLTWVANLARGQSHPAPIAAAASDWPARPHPSRSDIPRGASLAPKRPYEGAFGRRTGPCAPVSATARRARELRRRQLKRGSGGIPGFSCGHGH